MRAFGLSLLTTSFFVLLSSTVEVESAPPQLRRPSVQSRPGGQPTVRSGKKNKKENDNKQGGGLIDPFEEGKLPGSTGPIGGGGSTGGGSGGKLIDPFAPGNGGTGSSSGGSGGKFLDPFAPGNGGSSGSSGGKKK